MKLMKKMAFVFVCILALGASATVAAYPTKPITMVVGYAAGGGTHLAAEILAPGAEKFLGQPLEIVCKPGAGGAIGTTYVAKAPKDGYTILYATLSLPPLLFSVRLVTRPMSSSALPSVLTLLRCLPCVPTPRSIMPKKW